MAKESKCFFCKNSDAINNLIIVNVNNVNRKFHKECYEEYINTKKAKEEEEKLKKFEYDEFCKLYEYVKLEIMGYKKEMQLSKYARNRLQAMRIGQIRVKRNEKIKEGGYPYDVILTAFKVKKIDILNALKGKTFNSENHKFDYTMAIISNVINDVYIRYLNTKRTNETFETIDVNTTDQKKDYKKNNIQKDKVANLLDDLF